MQAHTCRPMLVLLTALVAAESSAAGADVFRNLHPRLVTRIAPAVRFKLEGAYRVAASKVASRDDCRRLFADLGADGFETLQTSLFASASSGPARAACTKHVRAVTTVGSHVVRVCRAFSDLSTERAALVLIHEALHTAGMSEKPVDPQALTSQQINVLVAGSCR